MSKVRRYPESGRDLSGVIEGPMYRPTRSHMIDRQSEIARAYYPTGQLQGERLRVRERWIEQPESSQPDDSPGWFVRWLQTMAGFAYVGLFVAAGWWWIGGLTGAIVGLAIGSAQVACHWS